MCQLVYFNLKTTGFGKDKEIVQIAGIHENGSTFNTYIMPTGNIDSRASEGSGITKSNGNLYKRGRLINDVEHPDVGLRNFLAWLREATSDSDKIVVLVAHNAFSFFAPALINNCLWAGIIDELEVIDKFADSLKAFKKNAPSCGSKAFEVLLKNYGVADGQAHDALEDAKDLKRLVEKASGKEPVNFLDKFCQDLSYFR
jgi:DNA polymerase III alpha subunit (gram-positive type)